VNATTRNVHEAGGDLRPADVYTDGERHARRPGLALRIAL
jgi:hypothetical protein